jgi:hypothetical protein
MSSTFYLASDLAPVRLIYFNLVTMKNTNNSKLAEIMRKLAPLLSSIEEKIVRLNHNNYMAMDYTPELVNTTSESLFVELLKKY